MIVGRGASRNGICTTGKKYKCSNQTYKHFFGES
jgi:hypothetical protein